MAEARVEAEAGADDEEAPAAERGSKGKPGMTRKLSAKGVDGSGDKKAGKEEKEPKEKAPQRVGGPPPPRPPVPSV